MKKQYLFSFLLPPIGGKYFFRGFCPPGNGGGGRARARERFVPQNFAGGAEGGGARCFPEKCFVQVMEYNFLLLFAEIQKAYPAFWAPGQF